VNLLESGATECDSHVTESLPDSKRYPKYYGHELVDPKVKGNSVKRGEGVEVDKNPSHHTTNFPISTTEGK
jgi:hypothetical protein